MQKTTTTTTIRTGAAGIRAPAQSDTAGDADEREGSQSRRGARARRYRAIRQQRRNAAVWLRVQNWILDERR